MKPESKLSRFKPHTKTVIDKHGKANVPSEETIFLQE